MFRKQIKVIKGNSQSMKKILKDHLSDTILQFWSLRHKLLFTLNAHYADALFKKRTTIKNV